MESYTYNINQRIVFIGEVEPQVDLDVNGYIYQYFIERQGKIAWIALDEMLLKDVIVG